VTSLRVDTGSGSAADDLSGRRAMPAATSAGVNGANLVNVAPVDAGRNVLICRLGCVVVVFVYRSRCQGHGLELQSLFNRSRVDNKTDNNRIGISFV